tara:strand:+ start:2042 stop:2500 length:459 start_codon:yes stop_codon:yes gene_type:complete
MVGYIPVRKHGCTSSALAADAKVLTSCSSDCFKGNTIGQLHARERGDRLTAAMEDSVLEGSLGPVVEALQALYGVGFVGAVTFTVEVGDVRRFDHPRCLMAYLGLVPAEYSTGESTRHGGIIKAGNKTGKAPRRTNGNAVFKPRIRACSPMS